MNCKHELNHYNYCWKCNNIVIYPIQDSITLDLSDFDED